MNARLKALIGYIFPVLGGLFGQRMMKKHFEKAGIVA